VPAPTFTNLTSGGTATAAASFTTASITPTANQLVLVSVHAYIGSGSIEPTAPTVRGNLIGYELVAEQQIDTAGTDRATLFVFRGMSAVPAAGTILIDFGALSITKIVWSVDQSDANVPAGNNGADAIVAWAGSRSSTTVTTQPTNFPQTMRSTSSGFFACGMQSTEVETPRASWTELGDVGTINSCCIETQYIAGTDTAGSSTWITAARAGSIVVEVSPTAAGNTLTAAVDLPDTFLDGASLLDLDTDSGDPALGYLYQAWPAQTAVAAGVDTRPQTGNCSLGAAGSGTLKKVAVHVGTGTAAATGTALEKKIAPERGTGTTAAAGLATEKKVAPQAGAGVAAATATGKETTAVVKAELGTGPAAATATATDKKVAVQKGTAALGALGTATDAKVAKELGVAAAAAAGRATESAGVTRAQIGVCGVGALGAATDRKVASGHLGTAAAASTGRVTLTKRALIVGTGGAAATGTGLDVHRALQRGTTAAAAAPWWLKTPPVIDVNGRVVATETAGGRAGVTQTTASLVGAASTASGAVSGNPTRAGSVRVDPTSDGRAGVG
jgi:hypothetical protein